MKPQVFGSGHLVTSVARPFSLGVVQRVSVHQQSASALASVERNGGMRRSTFARLVSGGSGRRRPRRTVGDAGKVACTGAARCNGRDARLDRIEEVGRVLGHAAVSWVSSVSKLFSVLRDSVSALCVRPGEDYTSGTEPIASRGGAEAPASTRRDAFVERRPCHHTTSHRFTGRYKCSRRLTRIASSP